MNLWYGRGATLTGYGSLPLCFLPGISPPRAVLGDGGGSRATAIMQPTLEMLLADFEIKDMRGSAKVGVRGLAMDSRRVEPGTLFFALSGQRTDGHFFVEEAIERGALGIVSEQPLSSVERGVTYIQVTDARAVLARMAARFYRHPDAAMKVIGITGTNGKTTVAMLTQFLLQRAGCKTGMTGTVHYDLGERILPASLTMPAAVDLYALLDQMRRAGCSHSVVEATSHGIVQKRADGLRLDAAAFLNLTQDHMDYHGSMEAYFAVKRRLFDGSNGHLPRIAVVNSDDPYGRRLLDVLPDGVEVVTFGQMAGEAMIRASEVVLRPEGTTFTVQWPEGRARVFSPLLGGYNVSNVLAALALCQAEGLALGPLVADLAEFPSVPGRMERVDAGQGFSVLVDFAHTDDALKHALVMLRGMTPGRLLVVFGCGGERDREKRPLMTRVVHDYADRGWATSDNPRGESLEQIFADMRKGLPQCCGSEIRFVEDRREAIGQALAAACEGDCVLIAGKGHEAFQNWGNTVAAFDDRAVAREWLDRS